MTITPEKLRAGAKHGQWIPVPVADGPMLADAMEIADQAAWDAIYCNTSYEGDHVWHDTTSAHQEDREWIAESVRYLDARGLLIRHPERPELVRLKDGA